MQWTELGIGLLLWYAIRSLASKQILRSEEITKETQILITGSPWNCSRTDSTHSGIRQCSSCSGPCHGMEVHISGEMEQFCLRSAIAADPSGKDPRYPMWRSIHTGRWS